MTQSTLTRLVKPALRGSQSAVRHCVRLSGAAGIAAAVRHHARRPRRPRDAVMNC